MLAGEHAGTTGYHHHVFSPTGCTGPLAHQFVDRTKFTYDLIIRLADEGVPIAAVARAVKLPSETVREVLDEAMDDGTILQKPRDDWAPGSSRQDRVPGALKLAVDDGEAFLHLVQLFGLTRLESAMLLALIKRRECRREQMHAIIEQTRPADKEPTDQKMVDVMICKLRKKLKLHNLEIKTIWSCGYYMPPDHRQRAEQMLRGWVERNDHITITASKPSRKQPVPAG